MSNKQYSLTLNQRRGLYLVAGLLWLVGIASFRYLDGLSVLSFVVLTLVLIGCSSYTLKINWWVNIGVIVVGIFWIGMSYLEHTEPIGVVSARGWWVHGIIAILVGIYWVVQRTLVRFYA